MSKHNEYKGLENQINRFAHHMWDEERQRFHFTNEQLQKLCDIMIDEVERVALQHHSEYVDTIGKETARISEEKRELRATLVEAGFAIPEGKRLGEWVKHIREGANERECTDTD